MKRLGFLLMMAWLMCSLSAKTIYLTPNDWRNDGAVFFVHSWGNGDSDVKMAQLSSTIYSAEIPDGNGSLIFVRMPNGSTSLDWSKKWNQTGDLTIPSGKNMYTITGWGDTDGAWSNYTPSTPDPNAPKFYITGDSALVVDAGAGIAKKWNANAIPSENDSYTLNLKGGVDYKLKITIDGTWETARGYSDLTTMSDGLTDDADGNICFTLSVAGNVKVTYVASPAMFKIEGSFYQKPVVTPCEEYGLMVDEQYVAAQKNVLQTEWTEYMLRGIELTAGQKVKLCNKCDDYATWVEETFAPTSYTFAVENGAYVIAESGKYDFYLKFLGYANNEVYVSKEGTYTTAVRSQCEDVMMQAFFNESYDNNAPGVSEYGNTKWTSLTPQAAEIGRYFDLVWLPPSANGDGMGYHPKQYSNQNSNWGTRAELETLIEALHNAGAKVVADIVINHCTGWSSWCDFPEMDFGEYGKFYPDASYICKNDEVNADWNQTSAGTCWGTATGSYDDGENWDGARDWSHDNVYVQEMFKAYLKWMRNVMHYDGFRYDKGDGFNNWHHDNYNRAAGPYIAFMECYCGTDEIQGRIAGANSNLMGLDFDLKWHVFNSFAGWDYSHGRGDCMMSRGDGRHSVTFIESHDWFLRPDNENEFGGRGNSMTETMKPRLLQANAFLLSMPGVPCVFYPHWYKYKDFLKLMIEARKLAGVHSESEVRDEYANATGYQATVVGKYGYLILCLGDKAHQDFSPAGYKCMASYYAENDAGMGHDASYQIWVNRTVPLPTGLEETKEQQNPVIAEKFLHNGMLFFRLGDKTYDVQGRLINQ